MGRRIVALAAAAMVVAIGLFGVPLAIGAARFYAQDEQVELPRLANATALAVSADLVQGRPIDSLRRTEALVGGGLQPARGDDRGLGG